MGKLFSLKEWLTVDDAARHLSIVSGENVTNADIFRLALDGHLLLSVYFVNHAKARCGKVVGYEDAEFRELSEEFSATLINIPDEAKGAPISVMTSLNIDDKRFLNLSEEITSLEGVWDLPMIGSERLDVEHYYQALTGGPSVTLQCLCGAFVEGRNGEMCQIQESFDENEFMAGSMAQLKRLRKYIAEENIEENEEELLLEVHDKNRKKFQENKNSRPEDAIYYPAPGLPKDSVIVVRTEALRELEQSINGTPGSQSSTKSPTFARIQRAIAAFPERYPDYATRRPKLEADVRTWLIDTKIANNEREAHVFSTIISEHFGF